MDRTYLEGFNKWPDVRPKLYETPLHLKKPADEMKVNFAVCLVSFATVTQQSRHLINLILSDGFRELRCLVCSALSLSDRVAAGDSVNSEV